MRITIRLSTNTSYAVTVPDNSNVQDLRALAQVACPAGAKLPADYKLIYNGQKLDPHYKSLDDFGLLPRAENLTVILMSAGVASPLSLPSLKPTTTVRAVKKKARCSFKSCTLTPLRMVGDCLHCKGKFCAKHRLLEDHHCQDLQFCRDSAHERNAMKLNNESTLTSSRV